ncbi:MAG: hypothetical protein IIA76_03540 [Proteobacteria bacterium]|nr:hypothetical protein [Pseudomonadota bacterium]
MAQAAVDGFELSASDDITESVLPTLELGKILFDRYAQPVVDIARTYISREFPRLSRIVRFFYRRKLDKLQYYIYTKAPERLDAERFRRLVTQAFSARRKTLRNALKGMVSVEQIRGLDIDPGLRPETLSPAQFAALAALR